MTDPLKSALAVLDAYMAGLNRGDEVAVNAACNFPHVRLAGGKVVVWQKRGEYRLDDFRARAGEAGRAASGTPASRSMSGRTRCTSR
jgi:hypothetical protein